MTMDADECQSGLHLGSRGALPKLAVRQLGRLIGIYMSSPPTTRYHLCREVTAGMDCLPMMWWPAWGHSRGP